MLVHLELGKLMHKCWASLGYKNGTLSQRKGEEKRGRECVGERDRREGRWQKGEGKRRERNAMRKKRREGGRESPSPILQTGFHHITSSSELKPKG